MANKNKKETNDYYYEKVVADEMQKAVSFELEHKSLWLWYILNSFAMFFTMFIFIGTEDNVPPSVQIMLLIHYGIMYFCLSLYNIRAADKGVLDSFSPFQKGNSGLMQLLGFANLYIPTSPIISYFFGKSDDGVTAYFAFYSIWCCMAWLFYIIATYSVWKNKKIRDSIAADDETEEGD